MTIGRFDFIPSWLDAALQSPVPSSEPISTPLIDSLLKALALTDQDKNQEADIAFRDALVQARHSTRAMVEEVPTIADLCFAYGRLLLKLDRSVEGNRFISIALRLYTRLYGIDDGRTQFCAARKRELARTMENEAGVAEVRFFIRAHNLLKILFTEGLAQKGSDADFDGVIERATDSLPNAFSDTEKKTHAAQIVEGEDTHIADLLLKLLAMGAEAESTKQKIVVFPSESQESFVDSCAAEYSKYVAPFNMLLQTPVVNVTKAKIEVDKQVPDKQQIGLYFQKGDATFKWSCSSPDDICILFNNLLRKAKATVKFYSLGNTSISQRLAYLLCSPEQAQGLKQVVSLTLLKSNQPPSKV